MIDLDQLAGDDTHLSKLWDREHDEFLAARDMRVVEVDSSVQSWQAFLRQVVDGRLAEDVAAELGCSVNSVLLAKSRVMKRLREELRGLVG